MSSQLLLPMPSFGPATCHACHSRRQKFSSGDARCPVRQSSSALHPPPRNPPWTRHLSPLGPDEQVMRPQQAPQAAQIDDCLEQGTGNRNREAWCPTRSGDRRTALGGTATWGLASGAGASPLSPSPPSESEPLPWSPPNRCCRSCCMRQMDSCAEMGGTPLGQRASRSPP